MDILEAWEIARQYQDKAVLDPDEDFMLIEAFMYMIEVYGDSFDGSVAMYNLASHYRRKGDYKLACKYFERSAENDNDLAYQEIGDIYYFGLAGQYDYEKAFKYYSKGAKARNTKAMLMLADMYKNGQCTEKDYDKYCELVFRVYDQIRDSFVPNNKGALYYRLADIMIHDGMQDDAIQCLRIAKSELAKEMLSYLDNLDLDLMKRIINCLYRLTEPDFINVDLYDLYYILKDEKKVSFRRKLSFSKHIVSSHLEQTGVVIEFDGKWFANIDDFFYKAEINKQRLPEVYKGLTAFKIIQWK